MAGSRPQTNGLFSLSPGSSVWAIRLTTFVDSLLAIKRLTPRQVDDFMASYVIYDLDWRDERQMIETLGPDYRKRVAECVVAYYSVLNHLCAMISVEKMYVPPRMGRGAGILENQRLYEESIARDLGLKRGDRVLDLGCGRGRVAAHIAQISGAHVTGTNIDSTQLALARAFNHEHGLHNEFLKSDFNELPLPFADESFDGLYQIQVLSLCPDLTRLFKEFFRVLKPGARLSFLDWVSLPAYDPNNPEHVALMRRVKPLIGAVGTPTPKILEDALQAAGFRVLRSDNPSIDGLQADIVDNSDLYIRGVRGIMMALVGLRILPGHFRKLFDRLVQDGSALLEMDRRRLVTTTYRLIAQKPMTT
jgi:sterol 24-C-methyltransferase